MFVGLPLLVGAIFLGLMYWGKSTLRFNPLPWPQLAVVCILVVSNALLYLMLNAVAIRRLWWKWLALVVMLMGPVGVASLIPAPVVPSPTPLTELFPPMLFLGLVWFLSGAATLYFFIRDNPLPSPEPL